jgi:inositol transporter-like SP family MFS transporter
VLTGLAVGADVPASWTLVVETAPPGQKGRRSGATQLLWGLGPLVVLTLALALSGLGVLGIRIVFAHLLVVALVLWLLRRRMHESPEWEISTATSRVTLAGTRQLLAPGYIVPVLLLMGMYGIWNLKAGTAGFFTPYLLRTVGAQSQAQSLLLQLGGFTVAVLVTVFVFMRLVDRARHWVLFAVGAGLQIAGMLALALFPLTTQVAIVYLALSATGGALGAQAFFVLWSAESFPTTLRATAMGLMFAIVRVALGIWSLFVPAITVAGFETLAWLLTGFLVVSSGCGLAFARHRRRASETVDLPRANGIAVRAT